SRDWSSDVCYPDLYSSRVETNSGNLLLIVQLQLNVVAQGVQHLLATLRVAALELHQPLGERLRLSRWGRDRALDRGRRLGHRAYRRCQGQGLRGCRTFIGGGRRHVGAHGQGRRRRLGTRRERWCDRRFDRLRWLGVGRARRGAGGLRPSGRHLRLHLLLLLGAERAGQRFGLLQVLFAGLTRARGRGWRIGGRLPRQLHSVVGGTCLWFGVVGRQQHQQLLVEGRRLAGGRLILARRGGRGRGGQGRRLDRKSTRLNS